MRMNKYIRRIKRLEAFPKSKEIEWLDEFMASDLFNEEEKNFVLFNIDEVDNWDLDDFELRFNNKKGKSEIYQQMEVQLRNKKQNFGANIKSYIKWLAKYGKNYDD